MERFCDSGHEISDVIRRCVLLVGRGACGGRIGGVAVVSVGVLVIAQEILDLAPRRRGRTPECARRAHLDAAGRL